MVHNPAKVNTARILVPFNLLALPEFTRFTTPSLCVFTCRHHARALPPGISPRDYGVVNDGPAYAAAAAAGCAMTNGKGGESK